MSKIIGASISEVVQSYLEPVQVGVGTASGTEALVHVVRQWCGRHRENSDNVLALLDISNAFNSVDRSAFRKVLRRVAPSAAPWTDFCYGSDSVLLLGQHRVCSARGIQQGDPLGPALFALAVHDLIQQVAAEVRQTCPDELSLLAFYLDDGVVGGSSRAVRAGGRAGGRADGRTDGRASGRTGGRADGHKADVGGSWGEAGSSMLRAR